MISRPTFLNTQHAWPNLPSRRLSTVAWNLGLIAGYFAFGVGALKLAFVGETVVVFWPPAGMVFAALWFGGRRMLPGVFLGSLAVDVFILHVWPPSLVGAFGNTVAPALTTLLLRRLFGRGRNETELSRVVAFILIGQVFGAMISATIGTIALTVVAHEHAPVLPTWGSWLMGDSIGVLMVAPSLLLWRRVADIFGTWRRAAEPAAFTVLACLMMVGFTFIRNAAWSTELYKLFTFVLILSAAARYGLAGAAVSAMLAAFGTVAVSLIAFGPYHRSNMFESFALFYSSLVVQTIAGLLLAAALADLGTLARSEKAAREAADAASANRIRLLTAVSHDVRTPLAGILGVLQTLQRTQPAARDADLIGLGLRAGTTLTKIISDILEGARMEAGRVAIEPAPFDARRSLGDIADLGRSKAEARGLALDVTGLDRLPPGVTGDRARFEQIFGNLVDNAIAYTASGSVAIVVPADQPEAGVAIEVHDTGPGLAPEDVAAMFAAAMMTQRPGRSSAGLGIGLQISGRLARMMGGAIDYRPGDAGGSCFRVTLPLPPAAAPEAVAVPAASEPARRVLLVEDDEIAREVTTRLLEVYGHVVIPAATVDAAVALAGGGAFDLVLTDVSLGEDEAGGIEVARRIRALGEHKGRMQILALTAEGREDRHDAYRAAGMDGVIVKPLTLTSTLAATLQAALWPDEVI